MNPQRGGSGSGGTGGNPPGGLSSALSEAQSIIAAAEKRAEEIRKTANEVLEEAKKSGYEQGLAEGKKEANSTAVRLVKDVATLQEDISREAARLAIHICRTILGEHLTLDESRVVELTRQALEHSISATTVLLIVHPDDVDALEREIDSLRRAARGATLKVEADTSLSRGGCIVRTDFGEVDATIEAILDNLTERLGI